MKTLYRQLGLDISIIGQQAFEVLVSWVRYSQQSSHVDFAQGGGQAEKSFNFRDLDLVHHLTCESHHHVDSLILLIIWLSLQLPSESS